MRMSSLLGTSPAVESGTLHVRVREGKMPVMHKGRGGRYGSVTRGEREREREKVMRHMSKLENLLLLLCQSELFPLEGKK